MDVKNAFLNGELAGEVYMKGPPGLENDYRDKVCKLKKSLYGLKQSPRAWFERFMKAVKRFGYTQCQADHTLFVHHATGVITILIVYVDDMIMTGNSEEEIQKLKSFIAKEFEIKDLGSMKYFRNGSCKIKSRDLHKSEEIYPGSSQRNWDDRMQAGGYTHGLYDEVGSHRRKSTCRQRKVSMIGGETDLFIPHQTGYCIPREHC
ncbi:hypothetical protein ACOSQ4_013900 [Xanthoceras sorbifolium]